MNDIISAMTGVFTSVGEWFMGVIPNVVELFYTAPVGDTPGTLTFLGVTTLASTGIALILLFIRTIGEFVGMGR